MPSEKTIGKILSLLCLPALFSKISPSFAEWHRAKVILPSCVPIRSLLFIFGTVGILLYIRQHKSLFQIIKKNMCFLLALMLFLWTPLYSVLYKTASADPSISGREICKTLICETNRLLSLPIGTFSEEITFREAIALAEEKIGCMKMSVRHLPGSDFFSRIGIAGIYSPFSGTSYVNSNEPSLFLPFTLCHELAHQAGFAREEDANAFAFSICLKGSPRFRLSACFNMLLYGMELLHEDNIEEWNLCVNEMSDELLRLFALSNGFQTAKGSLLYRCGQRFSDLFLRINGEEDGISSYRNCVFIAANEIISINKM